MSHILIFLPTLNEQGNALRMVKEIRELYGDADILVVDDNSSDNTVKELEGEIQDRVKIIRRDRRLGVGSAHKVAIKYAHNKSYEYLVSMDADGTHRPQFIQLVLEALHDSDVVIASRFLPQSSIINWPRIRIVLTKLSHIVTKFGLGLPYDCSSGFRGYRVAKALEEVASKVKADGYDFFFESIFQLQKKGFLIVEVPITLQPRDLGSSKMTLGLVISSVAKLFFRVMSFRSKQALAKFGISHHGSE